MPDFYYLKEQNLKYLDILIYLSIRSFNNQDSKQCFPSYETIAARCGASRKFVIEAIGRLEKAGHLKVVRSTIKHVSNKYYFPAIKHFEAIPTTLLSADLTIYQKAMLALLRTFFVHGKLQTVDTVTQMAKKLGLSYNVVKAQYDNLRDKGYISERQVFSSNNDNGLIYRTLTNKLNWNIDFTNKSTIGDVTKLHPTVLRIA